MSLSPAELVAARGFRSARRAILEQANADSPPDATVDVHVRHIRHDCARRGGRSLGIELREHYVWSPQFVLPDDFVPARRFAWIWTEGKCSHCGLVARSSAGRLVDPEIRPPAEHALVS